MLGRQSNMKKCGNFIALHRYLNENPKSIFLSVAHSIKLIRARWARKRKMISFEWPDDLQFCGVKEMFRWKWLMLCEHNVKRLGKIIAVVIVEYQTAIWMTVQQCNLRSVVGAKSHWDAASERHDDDTIGIPLVFCYAIDLWRARVCVWFTFAGAGTAQRRCIEIPKRVNAVLWERENPPLLIWAVAVMTTTAGAVNRFFKLFKSTELKTSLKPIHVR